MLKSMEKIQGVTIRSISLPKFDQYVEFLKRLWIKQKERCAICETKLHITLRKAHIDHCHKTGDVRGILCASCNSLLRFYEHTQNPMRYGNYLINYDHLDIIPMAEDHIDW